MYKSSEEFYMFDACVIVEFYFKIWLFYVLLLEIIISMYLLKKLNMFYT